MQRKLQQQEADLQQYRNVYLYQLVRSATKAIPCETFPKRNKNSLLFFTSEPTGGSPSVSLSEDEGFYIVDVGHEILYVPNLDEGVKASECIQNWSKQKSLQKGEKHSWTVMKEELVVINDVQECDIGGGPFQRQSNID